MSNLLNKNYSIIKKPKNKKKKEKPKNKKKKESLFFIEVF